MADPSIVGPVAQPEALIFALTGVSLILWTAVVGRRAGVRGGAIGWHIAFVAAYLLMSGGETRSDAIADAAIVCGITVPFASLAVALAILVVRAVVAGKVV